MKVNAFKQPGGVLTPADDMDAEKLTRFQSGEMYEIEIKLTRNPDFHKKVMAFFRFCFSHCREEKGFIDESGQFDVFRKNMTVLAGYFDEYGTIDGSIRVEAKSISYGDMEQDEFEKLYQALIEVAMRKLFDGSDEEIYNKLVGFF